MLRSASSNSHYGRQARISNSSTNLIGNNSCFNSTCPKKCPNGNLPVDLGSLLHNIPVRQHAIEHELFGTSGASQCQPTCDARWQWASHEALSLRSRPPQVTSSHPPESDKAKKSAFEELNLRVFPLVFAGFSEV